MMPDCTWPACQDLLPAAIAGTLAPIEQARVTQHLATCAVCRQAAAQWRQVAVLAQQADATAAHFERAGVTGTLAAIQARIVTESPFEGEQHIMPTDHQQSEQNQPARAATRATKASIGRQGRTGAPVVAVGAVLALIALAAALFVLHGRPTPASPATSGTKTTTSQTNRPTATPIPLPPFPQPGDIAAIVSATNAWQIVRSIDKDGQDQAAINHFDGQTWQQVFSADHAVLLGISMDSADDGWAVGSGNVSNTLNPTPTRPTPTTPLLLHYTHGQWVQVNAIASGFDPEGVQMLSANDGWMFGDTANGSALYHYNGSQWNPVPFAPHAGANALTAMQQPESAQDNPNPNLPIIAQLRMVSDAAGWGLGLWHGADVIWHDANGTWTAELPVSIGSNAGYVSIGVNAANDVWVLGSYVPGSAAFGTPANQPGTTLQQPQSAGREELHHFDGSQWQTVQLPASVKDDAIGNFVGDGNWIIVYSGSGSVLGLLHHAGSQWALTALPGTFADVSGLASQPDGTALAVALQAGAPGGAHLVRYANGTWTQIG